MNILVADKFSTKALDELRAFGNSVTYNPELAEAALAAALAESQAQILVVRSTKVSEAMLQGAQDLQLIVRAGAGVNTIAVDAASRLGIFVTNCPGKNAAAVAELTLGLIIALDRRIPENVAALRDGRWRKGEFSKGRGLKGRTLGLVGFGNIGREVAKRARAFGMSVCVWSRSLTPEAAEEHGVIRVDSAHEAAAAADVVSVHVAAAKETKGMCDAAFFNSMKDGALFINTSRGDVVNEAALREAVLKKGLRAGLDVYADEPSASAAEWKSALADLDAVYGTHHIGASTAQAEDAIGTEALRIIKNFCVKGEVLNCVNIDTESPTTHILSVRHLNKVGALASVLAPIREADINVLEMENLIFAGEHAAVARIHLSSEPPPELLVKIRGGSELVLSVGVAAVR